MRVPAIAWWPGKIGAGKTTQALATTMDLYATSLKLAGSSPAEDRVIDGVDLSPVLLDGKASVRDEIYYYLGAQLFAIRKGPWKMHYKTLTPYVGEQALEHDPPLLYHLEHDPSEQMNLAEKNPEIIEQLDSLATIHLSEVDKVPSRLEIVDESVFK